MARTLLATVASLLLCGAAAAQTGGEHTPLEASDGRVWQMILKPISVDTAATINPVLMTEDVCRAAITNFQVVLDDWDKNRGACLNVATGEVFGVSQ
jgi:hypothetical protein